MRDIRHLAAALAVCVSLGAVTCLAPMIPCGYADAVSGRYAGYGYHSLADVAARGFGWDSEAVPHMDEAYSGSGPYEASARLWIVLLYVPVFMAIACLGYIINGYVDRKTGEK